MSIQIRLGNEGKTVKVSEELTATVTREWYNKLLDRVEVELYLDHITRGTPSRNEIKDIVSKLYGVDPKLVIVKNIFSEYGRGSSKAHIHIYRSLDRMRILEPKHILRRNGVEV